MNNWLQFSKVPFKQESPEISDPPELNVKFCPDTPMVLCLNAKYSKHCIMFPLRYAKLCYTDRHNQDTVVIQSLLNEELTEIVSQTTEACFHQQNVQQEVCCSALNKYLKEKTGKHICPCPNVRI